MGKRLKVGVRQRNGEQLESGTSGKLLPIWQEPGCKCSLRDAVTGCSALGIFRS